MSPKLLSIVVLSASVLLLANDSTRQLSVAPHLSTLPNSQTKKSILQLAPQGVAHLRSALHALEDMEAREDARTTYAREAQQLYAALDDSLVWFGDTLPTAEARQMIEELKHADDKGLRVEDYDGPLWDTRLGAFAGSKSSSETDEIDFDVALTVSTMRFLSDLHLGLVNPRALHFIFRPYWNVPLTIQRNELVPEIKKRPSYLTENSYEILDTRGHVIANSESDQKRAGRLRSGEWLLRRRPGPSNSLGLVKFELPNPYDVYLHGTPAPAPFARSRRDFSHGCIRVEDPVALAVWILRGNPPWTGERIREAMNGDETLRVNLQKPIPAWILYGTAAVQEDGEVHFLKYIYGHDAALESALESKGHRI